MCMKNIIVAVILVSVLLLIASCKKDNSSSKYTTAPVITLTPPLIQEWGQDSTPYSDPGYTAIDAIDGNLTGSVVISGSVNVTLDGTYTRNYNVKDKGGLSAEQKTRTVIVKPF